MLDNAAVWMALGRESADGEGMERVLPQLEAVLQFTQEVNGRLAVIGVDGIGGALELYRRLKSTLDAIPASELERMSAEVVALGRALARLGDNLAEIRRLKTLVQSR